MIPRKPSGRKRAKRVITQIKYTGPRATKQTSSSSGPKKSGSRRGMKRRGRL